jgi:predicted Zn-dependent protease
MQQYWNDLADRIGSLVRGDEAYTATLDSEHSDFVRLNGGKVRQAGSVTQTRVALDWIQGRRHASGSLSLSGDLGIDTARVADLVSDLRERVRELPEDPHLLYATDVVSSERVVPSELPEGTEATAAVLDAAGGRDLVGVYAGGGIYAGFANSLGQRNWYANHSFNLDWSFHLQADKAVKGSYAGTRFHAGELLPRFEQAGEQLRALDKPARSIPAGRHRVYLAPAALFDIVEMLAWGGFGLRAHRTKTTPLIALAEGSVALAPGVAIRENTADGIAPDFQRQGFIRDQRVELVSDGGFRDCLVSPRSAAEYDVPTNGADGAEAPLSVEMDGGALSRDEILAELGTGIYVSNLWYLNYSDRRACRTTGMTRFATFWVENGVITAPLSVMRFDESVYRILGENLVGLTREREMLLDANTYGARSSSSARLPGALVDEFTFTL